MACYVRRYDDDNDKDGRSVVEWSLYQNGNEQPLIELTSMTEDFTNILDSHGWEKEGEDFIIVILR